MKHELKQARKHHERYKISTQFEKQRVVQEANEQLHLIQRENRQLKRTLVDMQAKNQELSSLNPEKDDLNYTEGKVFAIIEDAHDILMNLSENYSQRNETIDKYFQERATQVPPDTRIRYILDHLLEFYVDAKSKAHMTDDEKAWPATPQVCDEKILSEVQINSIRLSHENPELKSQDIVYDDNKKSEDEIFTTKKQDEMGAMNKENRIQ